MFGVILILFVFSFETLKFQTIDILPLVENGYIILQKLNMIK